MAQVRCRPRRLRSAPHHRTQPAPDRAVGQADHRPRHESPRHARIVLERARPRHQARRSAAWRGAQGRRRSHRLGKPHPGVNVQGTRVDDALRRSRRPGRVLRHRRAACLPMAPAAVTRRAVREEGRRAEHSRGIVSMRSARAVAASVTVRVIPETKPSRSNRTRTGTMATPPRRLTGFRSMASPDLPRRSRAAGAPEVTTIVVAPPPLSAAATTPASSPDVTPPRRAWSRSPGRAASPWPRSAQPHAARRSPMTPPARTSSAENDNRGAVAGVAETPR